MAWRMQPLNPPVHVEKGKTYLVGWDENDQPYLVKAPPGTHPALPQIVAAVDGTVTRLGRPGA